MEGTKRLRELARGEFLRKYAAAGDVESFRVLTSLADEIDTEVEWGYQKCPLDADGWPIHIGDMMHTDRGPEVVEGILRSRFLVLRDGSLMTMSADQYQHSDSALRQEIVRLVLACAKPVCAEVNGCGRVGSAETPMIGINDSALDRWLSDHEVQIMPRGE